MTYEDSIFAFDFGSNTQPETRDWTKLDGLREVPQLFNAGSLTQLDSLLRSGLEQWPDYGFIHGWIGALFEKQGDIKGARCAYERGISVSLERAYLCGRLAKLELDHGALREAVRWWTRGAILQASRGRVSDAQSFLFVGHVASLLGESDASLTLLNWCARGAHGTIALNASGKQLLQTKMAQPDPAIISVIRELVVKLSSLESSLKR